MVCVYLSLQESIKAIHNRTKVELWVIYAIGAAIGFSIANFGMKLVKLDVTTLSFVYLFVSSLFFLPFSKIPESKTNLLWAALIGVFVAAAAVLNVKAFKMAPNPGFPAAIAGLTTVLMYVYSWIFLGIGLSPIKLIGSLLVLAGVALVAI